MIGTGALLAIGLAVLVGAFVQGASGIGFALVVVPVTGFFAPQLLPVAVLVWMLPLNVYVAWRERSAIDWRGARWISAARVLATPLGILLLVVVPPHYIGYLIGGSTVLAAIVSLLAPKFEPQPSAFLAAGAITGLSETATGVGGPPFALVYQHRPAAQLRATVALCFLVGEVISLIALGVTGRLFGSGLTASLWLLPVVVLGVWASSLVHRHVGGPWLRLGILVFALMSGTVVILDTV